MIDQAQLALLREALSSDSFPKEPGTAIILSIIQQLEQSRASTATEKLAFDSEWDDYSDWDAWDQF